jgi:hypothetical protein
MRTVRDCRTGLENLKETMEAILNSTGPQRFYTSVELANILRKADSTIRRRCAEGNYEGAFKDGDDWLIPVEPFEKKLALAQALGEMAYKK